MWVSTDEMTDAGGRYVANVVIGTFFAVSPRDIYSLDSEVLHRVNHTTITAIFNKAMKLLREGRVK
jgi:hypothetical protein